MRNKYSAIVFQKYRFDDLDIQCRSSSNDFEILETFSHFHNLAHRHNIFVCVFLKVDFE